MKGRNYIVLSDLRQIQPMEGMQVTDVVYPRFLGDIADIRYKSFLQLDLTHLGTMFVLDRDHDGRISLDDLMKFATFCAKKGKDCQQPHEFQLQVLPFILL